MSKLGPTYISVTTNSQRSIHCPVLMIHVFTDHSGHHDAS